MAATVVPKSGPPNAPRRPHGRTVGASGGFLLLLGVFLLVPLLAAGANDTYTVKKGETLYRISKRFAVPVEVLQRYNGIEDPLTLRAGTRMEIPSRYSVRKGDTLYRIARNFGVGLDALMRLNGITDSTGLRVGATLFIPRMAAGAAAAPSSPPASTTAAGAAPGGTKDSALLWPHPGRREKLSGRITGTLIYGREGDPVVSVSSGRVVWAGPYRGFRRVILIEGENGYTYVYAGNEETLVVVGDTVAPGAEIGRLGENVHQGVPQLYFLVYHNGRPVDPSQAPRS